MKQEVKDFLVRHTLYADSISMDSICNVIYDQMKKGLNGEKSSLQMIPSYCSPSFTVNPGQNIIVIDAGGTNLRTCILSFDEECKPVLSDFRKCRMPGIEKTVSSKEFFCKFADEVEPLIDKSDRIGFCFSYAAEITEDHDGIPVMFSKEIKAPEVIGKRLGKELLKELASRGHDVSSKKLIICNDTVTTLLAGLSYNRKDYDGCIGFILGTGTNTAYIEKNCKIGKLADKMQEGSQIINMETGNLDICLGDIDRQFCDSTEKPELYHFEKMISGAYLGPLAKFIITKAASEGLFSEKCRNAIFALESLTTTEMSNFLEKKESVLDSCVFTQSDKEDISDIIREHIRRSAKLASANLASVVIASDSGKEKPVLINADGTTFYKTIYLESDTKQFLDSYLSEKGRRAVFTCIDHSPAIGAAIGALSL